jgi:gluconate 2-dehydrogenase gamma chain
MADEKIPRRDFLKAAGAASATGAALATGLAACSAETTTTAQTAPATEPEVWLTLNATEAAFTKAAVDTLVPADELTPSGTDVGLATFIDRQLAGGFGNGAKLYRQGPFLPAKPELGYQLALTPREFYRAGIEATNEWTKKTYGKEFDRLTPEQREETLKALEEGKAEFAAFSSALFFDALLTLAQEGFFADPMYGGNKNKVAWKMIGFPGLPASYRDEIKTYYNKRYDKEPQSIADFS